MSVDHYVQEEEQKDERPWQDSNLQSLDSKSSAITIRPQGRHACSDGRWTNPWKLNSTEEKVKKEEKHDVVTRSLVSMFNWIFKKVKIDLLLLDSPSSMNEHLLEAKRRNKRSFFALSLCVREQLFVLSLFSPVGLSRCVSLLITREWVANLVESI